MIINELVKGATILLTIIAVLFIVSQIATLFYLVIRDICRLMYEIVHSIEENSRAYLENEKYATTKHPKMINEIKSGFSNITEASLSFSESKRTKAEISTAIDITLYGKVHSFILISDFKGNNWIKCLKDDRIIEIGSFCSAYSAIDSQLVYKSNIKIEKYL